MEKWGLWGSVHSIRESVRYFRGRPHEDEFKVLRQFKHEFLALDVGANAGQSAISIFAVNPKARVLSFEPNPLMRDSLRRTQRLLGPQFSFEICGVGEKEAILDFYIPHVDGVFLMQEASTDPAVLDLKVTHDRIRFSTGQSKFKIHTEKVLVKPLDAMVDRKVDFIKIDVQGTELDVLKGADRMLRRDRPMIMFENSPQADGIGAFLSDYGYQMISAETNSVVGADPLAPNLLFSAN